MPTAHPRHSITETPALAQVLEPLRRRLGSRAPSLTELIRRGAEVTLRELDARDSAQARTWATFVDRLVDGPQPDLDEAHAIRHTDRRP